MKKVLFVFLFGIFLINLVSSIGVGCLYSNDSPLYLLNGDSKEVIISLQNSEIEEGIVLKGEILDGSEIASLDRGPYKISYEDIVRTKIKIKIPRTAEIDDVYNVKYKFFQDNLEGGGMVVLGREITREFKVIIVDKEFIDSLGLTSEKKLSGRVLVGIVILVIIILLVILYFAFMKEKF